VVATHPVDPADAGEPGRYDDLASLGETVRSRVVALAADVLPQVPGLPPAVRRVAGFAPNRRARLGGSAIVDALADDDLRERVAVQVAARPGREDDLTEAAARAWLSRGEGWTDAVDGALSAAEGAREPDREEAELARLRERVEASEQTVREARAKARSQVDEYKVENATLRRKLGESRSAERQARETAEEALRLAEEARTRAAALEAGQDKELRRLRARVEQLEAEQAAQRREEKRTSRADRDEATVRARLLLDSVIEAASGLRRELALPAVPGAPGDRVEAELSGSDEERGAGKPSGSVVVLTSGSLLEQVLSVPRSRLLVDGYNVSKTAWAQSSLESQRQRLLRAIAPLVARTGAETTVVFDAANLNSRPVVAAPRGVKVVFSPPGVIADDVLRDLVAAEPPGRAVVVVTDDKEVVRDARHAGARVASASALVDLLDRS
jgi:predicted RNA-binding protein with PIN domain